MNKCILNAIVLIILLSVLNCLIEREEGVIILNNRNFDIEISKYDVFVVEFYSPDCQHCKAFAPEYEKLTKRLVQLNPPIFTGKIDAEIYKDIAKKYNIKSVPQIYIFNKKYLPIHYTGELNSEDLYAQLDFQVTKSNEEINESQIDDLFISHDNGLIFLGENVERFRVYDYRSQVYFDGNFV